MMITVKDHFKFISAFFQLLLLILSNSVRAEQQLPRGDGLIIHLPDMAVVYNIKTNSVTLESSDTIVSGKKEWSAVKAGPGIYHVKNKRWQGFFWHVDINSGVVSEAVGREFGAEYGGEVEIRNEIAVKTAGETGKDPQEVRLMFKVGALRYDLNTKRFLVTGASTVLSYEEDWDIKEVSNMVFQFRRKEWKDFYWEFDFVKGQYQKKTGAFGSREGVKDRTYITLGSQSGFVITGNYPQSGGQTKKMSVVPDVDSNISGFVKKLPKVRVPQFAAPQPVVRNVQASDAPRPVAPSSTSSPGETATPQQVADAVALGTDVKRVAVDQGFAYLKDKIPPSEWMEKEKTLYSNILKQGSYDVMVVPLQVQLYAFDRANRSLITRRLAAKIERETDLRVADPTLVARALGERSRRFDEAEVYKLANELKVKYLVLMYAGHNLDERLALTVFCQERDKKGSLGPDTVKQRFDWSGVSFTDIVPPAESFKTIEPEVFAKLNLPAKKEVVKEAFYKKEKDIKVPENFQAISSVQTASPVLKAYYLQFLGLMFPADNGDDHIEMEKLFERSVIALDAVSPKSPDYPLLKARAYFYLGSRPAALFSLGDPKTPEEKALYAFINANIPELERWTKKITSPLQRLISEIELNDLRFDYNMNSDKTAVTERIKSLAKEYEGWGVPLFRRLVSKDLWLFIPNIFVKKLLDDAYPVPGLDAEGFLRAKQALGQSPEWDPELERKIYTHYRRVVEEKGPMLWANAWEGPVEADYFDLLYSSTEANLWKQFGIVIYVRGQFKEGLDILDAYEPIYDGNLRFMNQKAKALEYMSYKVDSQQAKGLKKKSHEISRKTCYWSQGESPLSDCNNETFYSADYPRQRWRSNARDRVALKSFSLFDGKAPAPPGNYFENLEHNLMYTHDDFIAVKDYYRYLISEKMYKEAEKLLDLNKDRFVGSPVRSAFLTEQTEKTLDSSKLEKFYRQVIADAPDDWKNYEKLGEFYLSAGEVKKAFDVHKNYPLYNDPDANPIWQSKYAWATGLLFYRAGAIAEARYFFQLAAGYKTGSEEEMESAGYYALSVGDYEGAAKHFRREANRYGSDTAYMLYMSILHVTGHQKDAWAVLNGMSKPDSVLTAMLVGSRMEGITLEEQKNRLLNGNTKNLYCEHVEDYFVLSGIIDRFPAKELPNVVKEVYLELNPSVDRRAATNFRPNQMILTQAYYSLRTKDYKGAFLELDKLVKNGNKVVFPYYAMAGAMSGNITTVESKLEGTKGYAFYYNLSNAIVLGTRNKHAEALKYLEAARNTAPSIVEGYPVMPWYSLVESCEWLYDVTGNPEYRDLALKYAKIYQQMMPLMAWAYAVEAKYTKNENDRLRALAITLYLDKDSERVSGVSVAEKDKALEWLKGNNPFLEGSRKSPRAAAF